MTHISESYGVSLVARISTDFIFDAKLFAESLPLLSETKKEYACSYDCVGIYENVNQL